MIKLVLFDVGHPAQVHNFKYISWELRDKGWDIIFTAKNKEMTRTLLSLYDLPYVMIGKTGKNIAEKLFGFFLTFYHFFKVLRKFKPGIVICRFSLHACWCCKLLSVPLIGLADTEHTNFLDFFTVPFANVKITADSYGKSLGKNHFRFKGNIELFYLHPKRFTHDTAILDKLNIDKDRPFVILRFVSWSAYHDVGEQGIPDDLKYRLVELLEKKYRVMITSENELPELLKTYQITFSPEKIHDVLSFASLYIGEGASMASEAACLGVYAVYVNSLEVGNIKEEAEFNLATRLNDPKDLLSIVKKLTDDANLRERTKENLKAFLSNKIDPTSFMVWFIENWPNSYRIMKENPGYQERFK